MISACRVDAVAALLDSGAAIGGVDGDGAPMAYAMRFGFVAVAELLGRRGPKRDLRFAAGLGELDVVKSWFDADGSLKPGAGGRSCRSVWTGAQAARAIAVPL